MEVETLTAFARIVPGSTDAIVNSFGAHFVEVDVDTGSGRVRVVRYVASHDSGRIINPRLALNQAEGAISQMLGFALSEELVTDEATGITLNPGYLEHKSPTILDYPAIQVIFADIVDPVGPLGAKALGEVPSVGVAPAVANAIYEAVGVRLNRLPFTPDRGVAALSAQPDKAASVFARILFTYTPLIFRRAGIIVSSILRQDAVIHFKVSLAK